MLLKGVKNEDMPLALVMILVKIVKLLAKCQFLNVEDIIFCKKTMKSYLGIKIYMTFVVPLHIRG